jgi:ribose-phosphate pyrophosphokinase
MLSLFIGKDLAEVKIFKFPAGESGVSFEWASSRTRVAGPLSCKISIKWESNDDLINLALLTDAVRRDRPDIEINLEILYFPYARQDRVCNTGESLSVKVIAGIINSLGFKRVYVLDPHSDVLGAVLNNMVEVDNLDNVVKAINTVWDTSGSHSVALVSPDAGALKKVYRYAKSADGIPVIRADKSRDVASGKITGTVVYSGYLGKVDLIVVDDICDGGGTFIPLAEELRKITDGTVSLFVTHGLFTKGVDIVADAFDNVFTANNMFGPHPKLKEI